MCVINKYHAYAVDQPYALVECNPKKRKSKFAFDEDTGLLHHQSDRTEWNNCCVRALDINNSRLKVAVCDASDENQVWAYDKLNGHVYLRADRKRCIVVGPIGYDDEESNDYSSGDVGSSDDDSDVQSLWMKISNKCGSNIWGQNCIIIKLDFRFY